MRPRQTAAGENAQPHQPLLMAAHFPDDLAHLVKHVESQVYTQPQRAIEAARELLKRVHADAHLAYVYEQLGFAHLILAEHRLSCVFYEQALALQPRNMYVLANLAHALYELGEHTRAVDMGRAALRIKDEQACSQAQWCSLGDLHTPYQGPLNLVSFSLHGQLPRYCEMAVLNVLAARVHLPDFVCRFYLDDTVPPALVQRLQALGAQCVHIGQQRQIMPATFWRFLAMDDAQADCVLVRDVDALIDARETQAVQQWRQSGQAFHIIRDDCCHTELILAGLLGIRSGVLRGIAQSITDFLKAQGEAAWRRYADQLFLRHCVWPAMRDHHVAHDRIYGFGDRVQQLDPIRAQTVLPLNAFIGANHAICRIECNLEQTLAPGECLYLTLSDAKETLICRYPMHRLDAPASQPDHRSAWDIHLPRIYAEPLQSGRWTQSFSVMPEGLDSVGAGSIEAQVLEMGLDDRKSDLTIDPAR